jgi:hypothetical protein
MLRLQDLLIANGATGLNGWTLLAAHDISADGRTIVGWGRNPSGLVEPYLATIAPIPEPRTCVLAFAACGILGGAFIVGRRRHG